MDSKIKRPGNISPVDSGSSGHANVVDHLAQNVTEDTYPPANKAGKKRMDPNHTIIAVQPLKKSEMQVRNVAFRSPFFVFLSDFRVFRRTTRRTLV